MLPPHQHPQFAVTRRRFLEVGSVAGFGLNWADVLHAADAPPTNSPAARFGQARSCVVIFLWGGPGQQDLWDPKPHAPTVYRSEFGTMATRVPGMHFTDQLPHLAQQSHRLAVIRSMSHKDFEHGTAAYTALTGHPHPQPGTNTPAKPDDFPTYGSVVTKLSPTRHPVPDAVVLGPVLHQGNRPPVAGQNAGFLGPGLDPFRIADDPNSVEFRVDGIALPQDMAPPRLASRRELLQSLAGRPGSADGHSRMRGMSELYRRAFGMLASSQTQQAFDLSQESAALRDRYGRSRFGQTLLLARRLVEAHVPLITVNWSKQNADQWDTHKQNYPTLRKLLPPFDRGLAAFLQDLQQRGLLESTLVVCLGEFGRTPAINKDAGRDHWPDCYSVVVAGGGIQPGQVFGSSNKSAAYPTSREVAPWDLAATMYYLLGIPPATHIDNRQGQPLPIARGRVISGLL